MVTRRSLLVLGALGAAGVIAGSAAANSYASAMADAEGRIEAGSDRVPTRFGTLEYTEAGDGRPLLMIHGTGGGFGYLRSDFPPDLSSENQADAFIDLLDALTIDSIPVIGGSAGALSAMQLAIRHPSRCSALLPIVPAAYAPEHETAQPMGSLQEATLRAMLGSDVLFWIALNTIPDQMIATMLATDPALVAAASPAEQARVRRILWNILPVSRRSRGLINDARLAGNPAPMALEDIAAPTLTISLQDDRFGTYDAARYIAAQVKGARLVAYPTGGHIWVGHDEELFGEIDRFLGEVR